MPEYLAPGVYTEEISTGPVPIEGVSTSTTGMTGPTPRGPVRPRLVTSWLEFQLWYGGLPNPSSPFAYTVWAAKGFFDNGGQRLFMARVCGVGAQVATLDLTGQTHLIINSAGPGALAGQLFVRVSDPTQRNPVDNSKPDPTRVRISVAFYATPPPASNANPPVLNVDPLARDQTSLRSPDRREPDLLEDFDNLLATDIEPVLHGSTLIAAAFAASPPSLPAKVPFTALTGGTDGAAPVLADYVGDATKPLNVRSGLAGLATVDEISLLCVPDEPKVPGIDAEMRIQCEQMRDRFAILQVAEGQADPGNILPPFASSYAAIYYPWIRVIDPATSATLLVPPCGHLAGIYAATDDQRGVHKAPANVEVAGILTTDLPGDQKPLEFTISKGDQEILNPLGINCIRDFRASLLGCRVWGARTLSSDAQYKYINVRRLFIFVEESVNKGTQWVVFEPNDEITWARVVRSVSNFLVGVWRSGALMGTTPDEAFFVQCDRTTMTQDDIDNGRLVCLVGLAPAKPAEFVIFRFSQMTAQATS